MSSRRILSLTLAIVAFGLSIAGTATAQSYPARPVRLLVGVAAGATNDLVARLIGQSLSEPLDRTR